MKLKLKILKEGDTVDFVPITEEYGRAEFICCPVFKRGTLKEFYIYPAQQPGAKYYYRCIFSADCRFSSFSIQSWSHKGMENPKIWIHSWCKKHKCQSIRLYVPSDSDCFKIGYYTFVKTFDINFDKKKGDNNEICSSEQGRDKKLPHK